MLQTCVEDVLYFGDLASCTPENRRKFAVVHACKEPCHRHAVGYQQKSLNKAHPYYLSFEKDDNLYLNVIDPPVPLFQTESFQIFLKFAKAAKEKGKPVLVHCNQGQSRAPSFALLFMAKGLGLLPNESYVAARKAFEEKFSYMPGAGIAKFLETNWEKLD
ncbi:MAG: hypothetical protein ACLFU1_08115 [Alphaproteobacteria bacterium]